MANPKMTFSLDEETVKRLEQASERLGKPKSEVVREAILEYSLRVDRLTEAERQRMLAALDDLLPKIPPRSDEEVDLELREIRAARRGGGRRTKRET